MFKINCPTCGKYMESLENLLSPSPEPMSFEDFIQWEPIYWCPACGTLFYANDSGSIHVPTINRASAWLSHPS